LSTSVCKRIKSAPNTELAGVPTPLRPPVLMVIMKLVLERIQPTFDQKENSESLEETKNQL